MRKSVPSLVLGFCAAIGAQDAHAQKVDVGAKLGLLGPRISGSYSGSSEVRGREIRNDVRVGRADNEARGEQSVAIQNFGIEASNGGRIQADGLLSNRVEVQDARNTASGRNATATQNFGITSR